jgi:biotin-dependent carboxylase-like uncharacterized protein
MKPPATAQPVLEIVAPGLLASLQDHGRAGWRRFGVPASGAMDDHAAAEANRLVGNAPAAPVLELLLQGTKLRVLRGATLAITGADTDTDVPMGKRLTVLAGEVIAFPRNRTGVWIYVAVAGGFAGETLLGSMSAYPRGGIGRALVAGDVLSGAPSPGNPPPRSATAALRDHSAPPVLRVWPGPQWEAFPAASRAAFLARPWTVSSQSDRVGYRLAGEPLEPTRLQLLSEPVLPGSIQVPENGLPIVTMRDGPTVGGYPKLGVLDPADIAWLAQCRPGQAVRFQLVA